ncbi:hypothetical protein EHQ53_13890 [Leptospira langatensis]|uniref:Cytochrome C Planctomycete-type domain-containing protein n=1 Tax=Leptospira langatensis TaxID=2484983 RepID=A0A5F1ZTS9_9LEPT|nr:hypothetical protein [Leptospira langatensis]TGK02547.1 hypothetical protein EHO57_04225 [Leptospira langatensis]TGL40252.1 hypothetical protein EHQ53_13890 [Leptospira langatensis]
MKKKDFVRYAMIVLLLFQSFLSTNCENSGADQKRDPHLFSLLASSSVTYVCADPQPTFASLNQQGAIVSSCGSCHSGGTINGGVDITSYSSVRSQTVSGNASMSVLYRVLLPGNIMSAYTTSALNQAVYCWIQGGSNP